MLITNDQELRSFLPNALATVEGEISLYEKLNNYLSEAETWIAANISGTETLAAITADNEDMTRPLLCRIAVCHALLFAIPSLDLVLTPNGFGIVNNQNIVPASKERVERLIATIEKQRDDTIILLLEKLRKNAQWVDSDAGRYWAETLFPNIDVCERMGIKEHLWDGYQRLRPQIIAIETLIANGFISPELMHDLHGYQFGDICNSLSADAKSAWAYLLTRLQSEVLYQLGGQPPRQQYLADLVNFIRNNIGLFQQWAESDTAKLYTPPVFVNKKEAQGYFF